MRLVNMYYTPPTNTPRPTNGLILILLKEKGEKKKSGGREWRECGGKKKATEREERM